MIQFGHMRVFCLNLEERRILSYFSSFPILLPLGPFPLSAHQSIGSETHGAQRGPGDVLAALRTTTISATDQPPSDTQGTFELDWTDFQLFIWRATASQRFQDIFLILCCVRMRLGSCPLPSSLSSGGSGWLFLLSSGHGDYRGMETM